MKDNPKKLGTLPKDKVYLVVAVAAVAVILIAVVLMSSAPVTEEDDGKDVDSAPPANDGEKYVAAVTNGDKDSCDSIESAETRELCKSMSDDSAIYLKAVKTKNKELCAGISDETIEEACINILEFGIEKKVVET